MSMWEIALTVESNDPEHMNRLVDLTRQYLEAAMNHTRRHDAKLIAVWLTRKEVEPDGADNSATD